MKKPELTVPLNSDRPYDVNLIRFLKSYADFVEMQMRMRISLQDEYFSKHVTWSYEQSPNLFDLETLEPLGEDDFDEFYCLKLVLLVGEKRRIEVSHHIQGFSLRGEILLLENGEKIQVEGLPDITCDVFYVDSFFTDMNIRDILIAFLKGS
jgi:hypothetical protein